MNRKVAVVGAGSWGTALGVLLAEKGMNVSLWARREECVREINEQRSNSHYLPDIVIPENITATGDLEAAVKDKEMLVLAVPSQAVRQVLRQMAPVLGDQLAVINTAKGLEMETGLRLSQVMMEELPGPLKQRVAVLSGPSHAEEVSRHLPTAVVATALEKQVAEQVQDLFMAPSFRVYTHSDLTGVELGGALKNIIALCTGISDGLGYGDNTKAALMTRGLAEMARLGVAMGAELMTFAGLAGMGDLVVTCTSMYSRNRRAGIQLGQGKKMPQILKDMGMVVEGVKTTRVAYRLSRDKGVEMPITEEAHQVIYEEQNPREGVANLMLRDKTEEWR
ncbi:NAD(P)H-dependent glycerol-3-phosphate dehydrogenase [Metallumcola ferriviriculae]|uniref:Glycerol-3-phosphate dehydrogenase [NAD(P)+] n=1 Tax=Metallumcola ferriviriculae TaxID=3039180 RepID=A0AAU0URP4_9FIRM|nr:NAD(P)H-dependent glycerol-3-phosphate dehydrogenase [Desulfitibacteraceae bacterium MK1]